MISAVRIALRGAAAATMVYAAALPSLAVAGSYVVSACSPSSSPGLWTSINTSSDSLRTGNLCAGPASGQVDGGNEGALYAEDVLNSPTNIADGARAGWTLSAPTGTTITAISYYRRLAAYNNRNMVAGLFRADGTAVEQCKLELTMGSSNTCSIPNKQVPAVFGGLNTSSLFLGVMCRIVTPAVACIAGGEPLHAARAAMYSARVTLVEDSLPAIADVAGPIWGGGVVSGVVPVTFSASDLIGIQGQQVRSDTGTTLVSMPQACDFSRAQPCPQQPGGSLSVDTRRVSDGPHTFSLVVTDAAGNSQVVTSPTVVVDNYGPPAPVGLTATAAGGGSKVIGLAWRNPASPPAPVASAQVQLCAAVCAAPVAVGATGAARVTAPAAGRYTVRLWLLDNHGQGGPHNAASATVSVPSSTARTRITAVLRGRRLRVSGTIARTGRVRVSWRSKVAGRTVGRGSRVVSIRNQRLTATFRPRARARRGTIRIAVRSGRRIVAQARVRRP